MGSERNRSQGYRDEDDYDEYKVRSSKRPRSRRKRRIWPVLLAGCGIGILFTVLAATIVVFLTFRASQGGGNNLGNFVGINNLGSTQTFTHEEKQAISLTALTQMQICDTIGNVSIAIDPAATTAMVLTKKIVHANSQTDANQEFQRIFVEVQPPGTITHTLTCTQTQPTANAESSLMVNVTLPNSDGLLHNTSDSVDVSITLPSSVLPSTGSSMLVGIDAPVGNVSIDGITGILKIKGSTGNILVTHTALADGSRIETGQGNVTFNGQLVMPTTANEQAPARYTLQSEQGNINVTLPSSTNVGLDANTNVGTIKSEFDTPLKNTGTSGPANYYGPLNTSASTPSIAQLVLDVSTGNISISKSPA